MVALVKKTFKTEKILARKVGSKQSANNEFLTDIDIKAVMDELDIKRTCDLTNIHAVQFTIVKAIIIEQK